MVLTALDFFERRSAKLYFDPQRIEKLLPGVIDAMADCFQWDASRKEKEKASVEKALLKSCRFN
jgi:glycerol-3-phosphate dehydrogenase